MVQKPKLLLKIAASVAVPAILAAVAAWLICRFYSRPFFKAFWPCLGGGLLVKFVLVTFNVLEACLVTGVFLVLAAASMPIAARFQMHALPAYAFASLASGMLASRISRRLDSSKW